MSVTGTPLPRFSLCLLALALLSMRPAVADKPSSDELIDDIPPGVRLGVWVGRPDGTALLKRDADAKMPTASSIKAALLIELFAMHEKSLDAPPESVVSIFSNAEHPAFVHYDRQERRQSRKALTDISVAALGKQMIRVGDGPNKVYNGAANVVIALLGGPEKATARIRKRNEQFAGHTVNRYMLADRNATGDNTATAQSLAAVHAALARREVEGLEPKTIERLRNVLLLSKDKSGTSHYFKGGSLGTDPVTYVRAGWWEGERPTVVYALMGAADPESDTKVDAKTLEEYVTQMESRIQKRYFDN
ncbi:serine hydrolase [Aeoliella sp.]|uniref:serine hydrolase n=1 Tax=Aeoliella sp. TaxID=2795800 RepID=UPI003CCC0F5D